MRIRFFVILSAVVFLLAAAPSAAQTTGSIGGVVTDELSGLPLAGVSVRLHSDAGGYLDQVFTAADGSYSLAGVLPGDYHLRFDDPVGGDYARNYWDDQPTLGAADEVTVVAATTSTANVSLAWVTPPTTGWIHGTVVADQGGAAIPNISVRLHQTGVGYLDQTFTDAQGGYVFAGVAPGAYQLRFDDPNGGIYDREYWNDRPSLGAADDLVVTAAASTVADASLAGTPPPPGPGSITGTVIADQGGASLGNISVRLHSDAGGYFDQTFTAPDGTYTFSTVSPGAYHLRFDDPFGGIYDREFWNDRATLGAADDVIVVDSTETVADASLAGTPPPPTTGYDSLFMGHSFFKPFAEAMAVHAPNAGFTDHTQDLVTAGGANGAPEALWNNATKRAAIQGHLDQGDIELFGMTYHPDYPTTTGYELWFDYALAQNPDTMFFLAMPWIFNPETYTASEYHTFMDGGLVSFHSLVDDLRALYPGEVIYVIPYGLAAADLYVLYDDNNLPDVDFLVSGSGDAIFSDSFGHADDILKDLGALVWLRAIYGVDLSTYPHGYGYTTDLAAIADAIMDAHDPAYNAP